MKELEEKRNLVSMTEEATKAKRANAHAAEEAQQVHKERLVSLKKELEEKCSLVSATEEAMKMEQAKACIAKQAQ